MALTFRGGEALPVAGVATGSSSSGRRHSSGRRRRRKEDSRECREREEAQELEEEEEVARSHSGEAGAGRGRSRSGRKQKKEKHKRRSKKKRNKRRRRRKNSDSDSDSDRDTGSDSGSGSNSSDRRAAASESGQSHSRKRRREENTSATDAKTKGSPISEMQPQQQLQVLRGSGRITSSGTVVHGHDGTAFMRQLSAGDALVVTHPTTLLEETRIVRAVVSDSSLSISSPFSSDLVSTQSYRYISAPKAVVSEEERSLQQRREREEEEKLAFGTYASIAGDHTQLVYRVKSGSAYGGYRTVVEDVDAAALRESGRGMRETLLDMRTKKKSDKFC